jgi:hypothetical protein
VLADSRKSPCKMRFDKNYFKKIDLLQPCTPEDIQAADDARKWVEAFPVLRQAMDVWWKKNRREERDHC